MPKKIELTGKIFGELTVLREATSEEKQYKPGTYWICQCSCGNIKIYNGQSLREEKLNLVVVKQANYYLLDIKERL